MPPFRSPRETAVGRSSFWDDKSSNEVILVGSALSAGPNSRFSRLKTGILRSDRPCVRRRTPRAAIRLVAGRTLRPIPVPKTLLITERSTRR